MKIGDTVRSLFPASRNETGTISNIKGGNIATVRGFPSDHLCGPDGRDYCFEYLEIINTNFNNTPMEHKRCETTAACDEIPKKLSLMERMSASDEDKTLIKAGYLKNGELTQKALDMIALLNYKAVKTQLTELAQAELEEAKE